MFERNAWILDRLQNMPLHQVDDLSEMDLRGTPKWENVARPVLSAVIDAYTNDNVDREDLPGTVGDAAQGLVPSSDADLLWELTVIGSAWTMTQGQDFHPSDTGTVIDYVRDLLEQAYEDGVVALARAVEAEADEAEADADTDVDVDALDDEDLRRAHPAVAARYE